METLGLTTEQAAIVAERGRDMLVTAGAGSGKTRVLVERYVSLLQEHRVSEIAAVTFTDAAAMEMRERVRRELLTRPELAHHRADIDEAVIGTIHSLCYTILREHPVEASIDPSARILPEDEAEFERSQACIDALEEAANADDRRVLALRELSVYHATLNLPLMVARRDEVESGFRAMFGDRPDSGDRIDSSDSVESCREHIRDLLDGMIAVAVEELRPQLAEDVEWLRDAYTGPGQDALSGHMHDSLAVLGDPHADNWQDLLDRLIRAGDRIKLNGGSVRNWGADVKDVRARMGAIRDSAKQVGSFPRWNEHDETAGEVLVSLRSLFDDACRRYRDRKRELAALDYLDLEIEATRLLRDHTLVAASYRARFRHLMVDELQDTNPAQIELLESLSRGAEGDSTGPERFFVGDAKQAIYRFRGGDVRNFTRLHHEIESDGGAIRALSQSFRAHDTLVETLNTLFDAVFKDPQEEFEAPMQSMTGRGSNAPRSPHLVLMPISTEKAEGSDAKDPERRKVEADAVAKEVAQVLREQTPVWDRDTKHLRPAQPSDVAVLLRRLTNVHTFEQALESYGVPYRTPSGLGFFTRQEVLDLTNLLGWLAEPDDSIALVGALRSPLFMIDDETLLALRPARHNTLQTLADPPDTVIGEPRSMCIRASEVLSELRGQVPFAAPDALMEQALVLTGFEAAWAPLQGGDQALANIRKFAGLARTLTDHSLDEFVSYVRHRRDELETREGQAVLDDSNAVRLLTVHGAKGLEFPIVFVPEAHVLPPHSHESVRWRSGKGVSLTLNQTIEEPEKRRRPGFYAYLMKQDEAEDSAEHKRLFYVAATRAADLLYISGDSTEKDGTWFAAAQLALEISPLDGVEIRPPLPVDAKAIARRAPPSPLKIPDERDEEDFMPPLVARPRVIPLRSSTPVTALQASLPDHAYSRHSDGLGLVRGSLAHKAIEVWFTSDSRPDVSALAQLMDSALGKETMDRVVAEVDAMLDRLDASPLAATLRNGDTRAYFELPFSWDWQGVPVHGTIDLAYQSGGGWHVLDFKTDDLRGRTLAEAASPYLPQLALYSSALQQATGQMPIAGLLFLRTGDIHVPASDDLDAALAATRQRVDAGETLAPDLPSLYDDLAVSN